MARTLLALTLTLLAACGQDAATEPSGGPATAEQAPVQAEPEATPTPVPTPDPPGVAEGRIRTALHDALGVIEEPGSVKVARLRVIGVVVAAAHQLDSDDRMGGYPIVGETVEVPVADVRALTATLLDDVSYDFSIERRCANQYFVGVRFEKGEDRVELVLGFPCDQAIWLYRGGAGVQAEGSILRDEPAAALRALAVDHGVRLPD